MDKYKVGIIGATGYTGSELVRILSVHPDVSLQVLTSESNAGQKFSDVYPQFTGIADKELQKMEVIKNMEIDLLFLALPHGVSMSFVKDHANDNYKIIDLSGDFRLSKPEVYKEWYGKEHVAPAEFKRAVFGLPELNRDKIRNASLVANPGCYPTSAILALAPLIRNGIIKKKNIIVDAKSGVTGAGAKAKQSTHFPEVFGNFSAYGLLRHRHTPEIQEALTAITKKKVEVLFTPHLLPIDRGILTTTYSIPAIPVNEELLKDVFDAFYEKERFVRVLDEPPSVKNVRGSNYCDVYVTYDERNNLILTVSVIDNLVKGAAGQAVQNMNIMFGLIERTGLTFPPLSP